jgi:hypothetical protein
MPEEYLMAAPKVIFNEPVPKFLTGIYISTFFLIVPLTPLI